MDVSKYKSLFLSETQEHLTHLNESLLRIERNAADTEAINEAFRNAHSMKGMAASMGYQVMRDLAHALEDLMDTFRQGKRKADEASMDILFKGLDTLEGMLQDIAADKELPAEHPLVKEVRGFQKGGEAPPPQTAKPILPGETPTSPPLNEQQKQMAEMMPGLDLNKYKTLFVTETQEHLTSLNDNAVKMERNREDKAALNEAFRNAHSIKGMAASMGYLICRDLAHAVEDLLSEFRDGKRAPGRESFDLIFKSLDLLDLVIKDIAGGREESPAAAGHAQLIRSFLGGDAPAGTPAAVPATAPAKLPEIELDFDVKPLKPKKETAPAKPAPKLELDFDMPLPGPKHHETKPQEMSAAPPAPAKTPPKPPEPANGVAIDFGEPLPGPNRRVKSESVVARAPSPSPKSEPAPTPEPLPPPEPAPALASGPDPAAPDAEPKANRIVRALIASNAAAPGVRAFILLKRFAEAGKVVGSRPPADEIKAGNFLPDPAGLAFEADLFTELPDRDIVRLINTVADVAGFEIKSASPVLPPAAAPKPAEPEEAAAPVVKETGRIESTYDPFAQTVGLPQTVRVKTEALDAFINALGEMIMVKSELREATRRNPLPAVESGLDRLDRLIRDFHDQVMTIRMMPLEGVVQRLPRVVRDLAKEEGKKVKFEVKGRDIELDRAILEQLTDALIHLLRNSVSHGIEKPEERQRLHKPEEGRIELEAYRLRDMVLIDVRDDGRGMDPFQLREAAVHKGILTAEEAEALSDEDAYQLIFRPGFSTAREVGMISGRGVGMDAVRSVAEQVGGHVSIATKVGAGTTFTLHLPRTIAIVNVLLVKVATEVFGVPISKILKTVEILPHQVRQSQNKTFYLDRQELIPIKAIHWFLDLPEPKRDARAALPALIVEVNKRKVALTVDDLVGQEEAFIRPLGKPLTRISGLSGVTMLGDGRMVFVLDTMSLM